MNSFEKKPADPVRKLIFCGLMTALITVGTLLSFPIAGGQGFVNFGDALIHTSAYLIGGWQCAAVAAMGSALADLILGYPVFIPCTFIVKGLMAFVGMLLLKKIRFKPAVFALSGLIMPLGYFLYELILAQAGVWEKTIAIADLPWNLIQFAVGAVIGSILVTIFRQNETTQEKP